MLGVDRFKRDAKRMVDRAGHLARTEAEASGRRVLVAGSLPPLFESYLPDRFQPELAPAIIAPLIEGLSPHMDLWLIETQSAVQEARVALEALKDDRRPAIVAYTLKGEAVGEAVRQTIEAGALSIFFNCSQPEVMSEAIRAARQAIGDRAIPVGVYASAFESEPPSDTPYAGIFDIRADLQPDNYLNGSIDRSTRRLRRRWLLRHRSRTNRRNPHIPERHLKQGSCPRKDMMHIIGSEPFVIEPAASGQVAEICDHLCHEAVEASRNDPPLARAINSAVLYHGSFAAALANRLAHKLGDHDLDADEVHAVTIQALHNDRRS